ncbi:Uncharacterized protein SCF082_LOCUS42024 [Durusdinium trenchii]|uniref:DUF1566 domain-containing protein n=1 Tax=Durusdinium trenchii TaxID=1381693 RepID=A0ABP0QL80_9DINO
MEMRVREITKKVESERLAGGWHNEISLAQAPLFWDEEMIANSKLWAQARNLVRRNEVHGKEEWRIPTSETFSFDATHSHEIQGSGSFEADRHQLRLALLPIVLPPPKFQLCLWSSNMQTLSVSELDMPPCYLVQFVECMYKKLDKLDEQKVGQAAD